MRPLFLTLLAFVYGMAAGQKSHHILTVYLEDAVTHENIKDAQVTLEGFEIPAIKAKYDKIGHFYYFDIRPESYTTVMVRHKKYNEKGFQELDHFPEKISFKLYTPYRIKAADDPNYYKEDSGRLAVIMNDTLYNTQAKCPDITDGQLCFVKSYFEKYYPELEIYSGYGNVFTLNDFVFYVMRKDRKPFGRFNDVLVNKMQQDDNILMLFGMMPETELTDSAGTTKTFFSETGQPRFIPEHIRYKNCDTTGFRSPKVDCSDSGLYLSYKNKYEKGLLQNGIYSLKKKELKTLYDDYRKRETAGSLYDFYDRYDHSDTIIYHCGNEVPRGTGFPYTEKETEGFRRLPYIIVSDALELSHVNYTIKNEKPAIELDYGHNINLARKYNGSILNDYYKSKAAIVKSVNKKNSRVYRLNIHASPFGIMDMIEYYREEKKIKVFQNIRKIYGYDYTQ
jgi:hypothetical protein